jgi:hypothetical protein
MRKSTWVDAEGKERKFDQKTWSKDVKELAEGTAVLKDRTYIKPDSGPDHYIWWCRYNAPNYLEYRTAMNTLPARAVSVDTDPYYPEGFEVDANGHFVFGDLILMKRKYADYLKDEIAKVKRSRGSSKALMAEYEELTKSEGVELPQQTADGLTRI